MTRSAIICPVTTSRAAWVLAVMSPNPTVESTVTVKYNPSVCVSRPPKLLADIVAMHGAGRNYLIEHSAGSGKSNTIAWLAHRLTSLFRRRQPTVFHKVIMITNRVVLDRQLQRTIYQFDHTPGVVRKIDVDSAQRAGALEDATSKIIISTLQMYPYVLDKIADAVLGGQRYAVIIDEAHSSQGGDAAARLKQAPRRQCGTDR